MSKRQEPIGISLEEVMNMSPATLAEVQETKLAEFAAARLRVIANLIIQRKYDEAKAYLSYSPGGDDMGCDNDYISFIGSGLGDCPDLGDVLDHLIGNKKLRELSKGAKK